MGETLDVGRAFPTDCGARWVGWMFQTGTPPVWPVLHARSLFGLMMMI